jgi:hypothetical protein
MKRNIARLVRLSLLTVLHLASFSACADLNGAGGHPWMSLGSHQSEDVPRGGHALTEAQVREDVVRFASSYFASLTEAFDAVERAARTPDARLMVADPKVKYCNALIDIALGPNPQTDLLDMVVLSTLLHDVKKDYWVPRVYGASGQPLLIATEQGKQDIWSIADKILTPAAAVARRSDRALARRASRPDLRGRSPAAEFRQGIWRRRDSAAGAQHLVA